MYGNYVEKDSPYVYNFIKLRCISLFMQVAYNVEADATSM